VRRGCRLVALIGRWVVALFGAYLAALPATALAGVIWTGDAEQPASEQWASSAANGAACDSAPPNMTTTSIQRVAAPSPVAQGKYSYHFQVSDGEDCFGARAELGQGNPPDPRDPDRYFYAGQNRWISFQAYLPDDFQLDDPLGQSTGLMQLKQQGADGQPALGIGNGEGYLCLYISSMVLRHFSPHCGDGYYDLGQPSKDTWIKLTLHVYFSPTGRGLVAVYGDLGDGLGYRELLAPVHAPTMKAYSNGDAIPSQARIGIYRSLAIRGTEDLYSDGFTVATDQTSAEDNAFAPPSSTAMAPPPEGITLGVSTLVKHHGRWVHLQGQIHSNVGQAAGVLSRRVIIRERVHKNWRIAARGHTANGGTFSMLLRLPTSRVQKVLVRATIVGVGRSNTAVVRIP
jgi:hypothetical protein